jgi:hypothetical protein
MPASSIRIGIGKMGVRGRHTGFFRWAIIWARMLERAFRRVDWIRVVVRGDLHLPLPVGNIDANGNGITPYSVYLWG